MKDIICTSHRLALAEVSDEDIDFIIHLVNQPGWIKYIGDRKIYDKEAALNYIDRGIRANYSNLGYGLWKVILKEIDTPIGICGFLKRDYLHHPDIGFAFLEEFEGQGYAFESAQACIEYAKAELNFNKIHAITKAENQRSIRLLEKLGMIFSSILADHDNLHLYTMNLDPLIKP